ncbi:hypothetical protein GCM10007275_20820 [Jeotgalicoccus coquinae]|uniref:DUF4129 domain-containing protein n=1 Tax=Jeotgalicoccus coquinae TaxID=709509 RepID=A0A6V7RRH9_9STAP|nr:hypothetical protein [Jeotgalicoccus coquinae]MBB6424214.1 hypothetical protein [Jeotgalicoccus coquinae]GGE25571.1 hypothetical protein GCM10007275_20820 [Jeotgalicoccus coquinae]CAD2081545.1 hypothetical protein JEOCOQ751_02005 [Jeotgalicoccus coquinae]
MNKMKYYSMFVFYFIVEMFVPVFIGVLINIHNTSSGSSYLLPLIIVLIVMLALSHFIADRFSLSAVYILVPIGIVMLMATGSYWLTAFLVTGFAVWTLEQLHDNINNHYNDKMLVIMFVLLIIINMINSPVLQTNQLLIHLISLGMFVFYFPGRIIILMTGSGYGVFPRARIFVLATVLLLSAATLFTGVYKYVVFAVQTIFIFLLNGFIMMLRPFFSFLETVEFKFPDMEQEQMEVNDDGDAVNDTFESTAAVSEVPVMTILAVLAAAGIAVFLIMYFKKRSRPGKVSAEDQTYKTTVAESTSEKRKNSGVSAPDSRVRKQYYMFEKWLAERDLGRYHGETIDEWAGRLNLGHGVNKVMLERYKRYRYDSREMSQDEFIEFKEMIKKFKRTIDSKSS